ncbi:hypothetical protein AAFF_G00036370 [Aldrovandia affinis]|uniref:Uncharacterized protein n=1 Tax=Aldrovandia affinis TaxID=143900 RepID=A0AAD7S5J8_9TELE|nr:hypothetical protein AAFF_G00036370 [Aldrovandia affinis]
MPMGKRMYVWFTRRCVAEDTRGSTWKSTGIRVRPSLEASLAAAWACGSPLRSASSNAHLRRQTLVQRSAARPAEGGDVLLIASHVAEGHRASD